MRASFLNDPHLTIELSAILQKSLDRALFLYNFIREVLLSGIRASITVVHIRKFFKMHHNIFRFIFFFRIAKRSIRLLTVTVKIYLFLQSS